MGTRTSAAFAVLLAGVLLAAGASGQQSLPTKSVATGPEDIVSGVVALPDPARVGWPSRSALVDVVFDEAGVFRASLPVVAGSDLSFALLGRHSAQWEVSLVQGSAALDLAAGQRAGSARRLAAPFEPWRPDLDAVRWDVSDLAGGPVALTVRTDADALDDGVLLVSSAGPWRLASWVSDWRLTSDRQHVLRAALQHQERLHEPVAAPSLEVGFTLWGPAGRQEGRLFDDGQHDDGAAGDGVYGARLPLLGPGSWVARVEAQGQAPDGSPVWLGDETLLPVLAPAVSLGAEATASVTGTSLEVALPVRVTGDSDTWHASAEVWGTAASGALTPVAWISGMVAPELGDDGSRLALSLHGGWLDRAGASPPLELREVRIQDRRTHGVLARAARMPLRAQRLPPPQPLIAAGGGPAPPALQTGAAGGLGSGTLGFGVSATAGPGEYQVRALMLVHGYCSSLVWPVGDFSGDLLPFADPNANRSHDDFAQLIGALGALVSSHGVVAHSQGGPASLQLLTYYWSPLDLAHGGRRIQSVGSPYQGTALAGDLAVLGQIFGAGCGTNFDLSYDGAALWLSGIPTWARAEVSYFTTSFSGLWCDFVTNLILDNPEDGVVELVAAQLPGGNNMGHVVGQCHTTGMSNPAQYHDQGRNAQMNDAAAR
jgi:hypothetical protein